jgi:hypothetical protein
MSDASRDIWGSRNARIGLWIAVAILSCLRLTHVHLLWADEDYHLAAALNVLHGRIPYREFWYDKPPLGAAYYLFCAAYAGWPLRLLDAAYVLACCYLVFRIAHLWWGKPEGRIAAFLFAFFLTFYLPSAVIPFAADALMILPHLAAIHSVLRRRPWSAGAWCGIAFLVNIKAVFVLATCGVWLLPAVLPLVGGFLIPLMIAFAAAVGSGAWSGYCEQVWRWGMIYARQSPNEHPAAVAIHRTLDWLGFHGVLTAGALYGFARTGRADIWRLASWLVFSFIAVCLGWRFEPRYFLQLLPPMVLAAARGGAIAWRERPRTAATVAAVLLLVPFVRFVPAYVSLALNDIRGAEPHWSDIALDLDSQHVAQQIRALAHPGDTVFVWGYRPDIYVYTRMISGGLFSDSQPLTGVPADRHLHVSQTIYSGPAARNRILLANTHPTFVVDGLGLLNPNLAPTKYPELRRWLATYRLIGGTSLSLIYRSTNQALTHP